MLDRSFQVWLVGRQFPRQLGKSRRHNASHRPTHPLYRIIWNPTKTTTEERPVIVQGPVMVVKGK